MPNSPATDFVAAPGVVREVDAFVSLLRDTRADFGDWDAQHSTHPPVEHPDGLPHGWTLRSSHSPVPPNIYTYHLVTRPAGGCVVLAHTPGDEPRTHITRFDATLADLWTSTYNKVNGVGWRGQPAAPARSEAWLLAWLDETLAEMFDTDDPVESAERILVALGNPMTFLPSLARTNGYPAST